MAPPRVWTWTSAGSPRSPRVPTIAVCLGGTGRRGDGREHDERQGHDRDDTGGRSKHDPEASPGASSPSTPRQHLVHRRMLGYARRHADASMTCSNCGTENRGGRKFCSACGAPLSHACPECGALDEPAIGSAANAEPRSMRDTRPRRPARARLRAETRLCALRRPGGVHDAVRSPRPRRGTRAVVAILRDGAHADRAVRWHRREVHRRRRDGGRGTPVTGKMTPSARCAPVSIWSMR